MYIGGVRYIGARAKVAEGRWAALLVAAVEQGHPSPALVAAIQKLQASGRGPARERIARLPFAVREEVTADGE